MSDPLTCTHHPIGSLQCDGLCDVVIPDQPPAPKAGGLEQQREWLAEFHELYGAGEVPGDLVANYTEAVAAGGKTAGNAELHAILGLGWSVEDTAHAVGIPVNSLCTALWPSVRPRTALRIEQELRAGATSQHAVARLLRCSQQLVGRISHVIGVEVTGGGLHEDSFIEEALELRGNGLSYRQIGDELGISKGAAQGIIRRHSQAAA